MWFRPFLPTLLVSPVAWISLLLAQLLNALDWMTTSKYLKPVAEFRITCENLSWRSHAKNENKQASKSLIFSTWKLSTNQRLDWIWKVTSMMKNQLPKSKSVFLSKFFNFKIEHFIHPCLQYCLYVFLSTIYWCCIINYLFMDIWITSLIKLIRILKSFQVYLKWRRQNIAYYLLN